MILGLGSSKGEERHLLDNYLSGGPRTTFLLTLIRWRDSDLSVGYRYAPLEQLDTE